MKTIVYRLSIIGVAGALLMTPVSAGQTYAARGCCMQLAPDNQWYRNGMSFNQCRAANRSQDKNDDFYSPSGHFWWNVNC